MKLERRPQSAVFRGTIAEQPAFSVFDQFKYWYFDEFPNDPLYRGMNVTKEINSPWHIEDNVGCHTDMVVTEYLMRTGRHDWDVFTSKVEGAFACAFHDVGKKDALVEKHSEERGDYVSFPAHEIKSARLWEDWAMRNISVLEHRFGFTVESIYNVSWMIEHHLPWGVKKHDKREAMVKTCIKQNLIQVFQDVLLADTYGRISTDAVEKREKVWNWIEEFKLLALRLDSYKYERPDMDKPLLVMPIGASGSGKTTVWKEVLPQLTDAPFTSWSLDDLRHEWYDKEDYFNAYTLACADKEFMPRAQKVFSDYVKSGVNIYADNLNISRKRRAHYINMARQHGYTVVGIPLIIGLKELETRNSGRGDKFVPLDAVKQHYFGVQQPQYGEFDLVHVHDGNLPKLDKA